MQIPKSIPEYEDFKKELDAVIWDENIEPDEFEAHWLEVMQKFNTIEHTWLKGLYDLKELWIPAYFR